MFPELFSTSTIFSLLLILLIGGILYFYLSYKLSEQDHKLSSMLGLVSTFADELNFLKSRLASSSIGIGGNNTNAKTFLQSDLIEVSDNDEESEEESDAEDSDEEDNESLSEEDNDSDDEDNKEEEEEEVNVIDISENNYNKKIIISTIKNDNDENLTNEHENEMESTILNEENDDHSIESISSYDEIESDQGSVVTRAQPTNTNQIKKINILDLEQTTNNNKPFDFLKSLNLNEEPVSEQDDLKKLPISKLRQLLSEKGYKEDTSKLKKNELVKLLQT